MYPEYPFQKNFITINGHHFHYIDEGEGPVVVMSHGNPTWSYYYRRLISLLKKTHRVIVPDHLGCGLSDKPQGFSYTLANHIEHLNGLLDHLEVERYSLVVHDWGGPIGLGCAVQHPGRIEKIMILNTAAFRSARIPLRIRVCRWPVVGRLIVKGLNGFCRPATVMAVEQPLAKEVKDAYLAPYDTWRNRVAIHAFVADIPLSSSHSSYKTLRTVENGLVRLRQQKIPMKVIWGAKDFCFNTAFYHEWKQRFPGAEFHYLKDCGHYVLEDGWDRIKPLAQRFFVNR